MSSTKIQKSAKRLATKFAVLAMVATGVTTVTFVGAAQATGAASTSTSTISAAPSSIPANGVSTSLLTLHALDANGNPVLPGTWQAAQEVAGTLNAGGSALVNSISCSSDGNCAAAGSYEDSSLHTQAFVVNETSGTWGAAQEVAGSLNVGGSALVNSISCSSDGNCAAAGYYRDSSSHYQAFVVNETSGTWGAAQEVAGSLNGGGSAQVNSISCSSNGNCAAAGYYEDSSLHTQAFVVNETSGTWGAAQEVAGSLNGGSYAQGTSISCSSDGNCAAAGSYRDSSSHTQAFVVNETMDVTFSTTLGSLGVVTDNGNGTYSATLTSSTTPGTATISGAIDGVTLANPATVNMLAVSPQLLAQAPMTLTSTRGVVGTPLTLNVTGGSGAGALRDILVSAGSASCALSGDTLSATTAGSCTILVFKAGDAEHLAAITSPTTVSFTSPTPVSVTPSLTTQAPLKLTSNRGVSGTPLTLHSTGGSGTGTLTFTLNGPGSAQCTLHANVLTARLPGTCAITLTKAGDATYLAANAVTSRVTFTRGFFATRVEGVVRLNATSQVTITGSGFYNKPTVTSNDSRTSAVVIHDHGTSLIVRVTSRRGAPAGTHEFTITLANGKSCRVKYLAR